MNSPVQGHTVSRGLSEPDRKIQMQTCQIPGLRDTETQPETKVCLKSAEPTKASNSPGSPPGGREPDQLCEDQSDEISPLSPKSFIKEAVQIDHASPVGILCGDGCTGHHAIQARCRCRSFPRSWQEEEVLGALS